MPTREADHELRARIRARIEEGAIPCGDGGRLFAGLGEGLQCGCCDRPISPSDVQYEVERSRVPGDPQFVSMHMACFTVWAEVCREISRRARE